MNREAIWSSLFTLITSAPGIQSAFATTGRLARPLESVSVDQMPALFLLQQGESRQHIGKGIPRKRTLRGCILFYVATADASNALPATLLNNAMDAIDTLFDDSTGKVQTLGGLVEHVYLEGETRFYEGLLQEKSPATVPITILVP